ncbi:Uncharacterized protein PHSC3_001753 [Chlamydiales bacterium STE3]|nr:Uncharacterized protein PHSC3_001753 [Chlamydiales bacterium STE3]
MPALTTEKKWVIFLQMMQKDTLSTIFHSAAKFFSGTFLSRISGMLRDMSIAYAFGTESMLATFFIAFRFSHLARRLFGEGSMQTAFVPCFEDLRLKSEKQAVYFFRDLLVLLTLCLLGFIALSLAFIGAGNYFFSFSEKNRQLLTLTSIMLPSLLFICLYGLNTAYLECEKCFFIPSIAPVAFNSVWIAASLLLAQTLPYDAMKWLSIAVVMGCAAQWAVTVPKTYQLMRSQKISFWENCHPFSSQMQTIAKPLLFANISVAASQVNNALDPLFARFVTAEGPAWLWYAIRLQQLPLSLFGIALAGALLPPLSRAAKSRDMPSFYQFLDYALSKTTVLMVPITIATLFLGQSAINLIFGRGQFQTGSVLGTTCCLWGYAIGLLPMSLIVILAPALYALGEYSKPMRASLYSVGLNIALNTFFVFFFGWGATSIAIATSLAAWLNCLLLMRSLTKSGYRFTFLETTKNTLLSSASGALAVIGVDALYFGYCPNLEVLLGQTPSYHFDFLHQASEFSVQALGFILGFACLYILLLKRGKELRLKEMKR